MLSAEGLAEQVAQYNPKSNSKLIMQAYAYGRMKHEGPSPWRKFWPANGWMMPRL